MAWIFVTVVIPLVISMAKWIVPTLASWTITAPALWEALAMTAYLILLVGLPPLLALRERKMRRAGELL